MSNINPYLWSKVLPMRRVYRTKKLSTLFNLKWLFKHQEQLPVLNSRVGLHVAYLDVISLKRLATVVENL